MEILRRHRGRVARRCIFAHLVHISGRRVSVDAWELEQEVSERILSAGRPRILGRFDLFLEIGHRSLREMVAGFAEKTMDEVVASVLSLLSDMPMSFL